MLQVSYIIINSQLGRLVVLPDNGSMVLSYTWTNLADQGRYQFSVVAFTSAGSGEAATAIYSRQNGKLLIYKCS